MSLGTHNLEFGEFLLDTHEKVLLRSGVPLPITPKAFELLVVLVNKHSHLIEKAELMRSVWADSFVEEGNLTFTIGLLRKVLDDDTKNPRFIETVPKRGYRFIAEVRRVGREQPTSGLSDASLLTYGGSIPHRGSVVALADLQGVVSDGPEKFTAQAAKSEFGFTRTIVKRNSKYLAAAAVVLGAIGLGYYFYSSAGGKPIDSVAILPFVNLTGDANSEYLSDGISDSIINSLSRLPDMKVISLNSVLRYKGKQIDPQSVGRELNVSSVLIGRFTRQGDNLAISAELVDVTDSRRLWGSQFTTKVPDLPVVQVEIARQISDGLRLQLSGEQKQQLAKRYTENAEAYQLYILARHYHNKQTKEGFEKSLDFYNQAIEKDPSYALAYAGLANAYYFMGNRGFLSASESDPKVEWAARKALEIDSTLAEGHTILGVNKYSNFDWEGSADELRQALELDPNSVLANTAFGNYLASVGRPDDAIPYAKRAAELDPTTNPGLLAQAYFLARRYDTAIELFLKVLEKNPERPQTRALLGEVYLAKAMYQQGVAELENAVTLDNSPERWDRHPMLAFAYAISGRRDEAVKILDQQNLLATQGYISPYNFAIIYTGLGDKDRAFEWLEKGYEQRTQLVYRIKSRPMFDSLRADPRYVELLRKMNLTP